MFTRLRSLIGSCLISLVPACASSARDGAHYPAKVHVMASSPAGISANAYLIESEHGVVAVDSALTNSDARTLRQRLDDLDKPLLAVLLTHGHPDHYNGVSELIGEDVEVPIYASASVDEVIRSSDAAKEAQWKPMFGAEWPERRTFPNAIVKDGERLQLDGLAFTLHELGPGESHADTYWVLEGTTPRVFVGDVVIHGHHAYVSDGHTSAWLANITGLRSQLPAGATLHPGHGASGGLELLDWQEAYLTAYRGEVDSLRNGADELDGPAEQELTQRMKSRYPEAGLDFLIALGADTVAAELAAQAQGTDAKHVGERK